MQHSRIFIVLIIRSIDGSQDCKIYFQQRTILLFHSPTSLARISLCTSVIFLTVDDLNMPQSSPLYTCVLMQSENNWNKSQGDENSQSLTHCDLHLSPGCVAPVNFCTKFLDRQESLLLHGVTFKSTCEAQHSKQADLKPHMVMWCKTNLFKDSVLHT